MDTMMDATEATGPNSLKPATAQSLPLDPEKPISPEGDSDDNDSEWEYEYSTTETETFYVTLDMSVPDIEIQQPQTFTQDLGPNRINRKWVNPLMEPLSHAHGEHMQNLAIQSDDEAEDRADDYVPPPRGDYSDEDDDEEIRRPVVETADDEPKRMTALEELNEQRVAREQKVIEARREKHRQGRPGTSSGHTKGKRKRREHVGSDDDDEAQDTSESSSETSEDDFDEDCPDTFRRRHKVQVLGFHYENPLILFDGRTYVGEWSRLIGTDLVFAESNKGSRFPILRHLNGNVDLVAACSARIQATEVMFTNDGKIRPLDEPRDSPDTSDEELERERQEKHNIEFLRNLQRIKWKKGETDLVPIHVDIPEDDIKAMKRKERDSNRRRRKHLMDKARRGQVGGAYGTGGGSGGGLGTAGGVGSRGDEAEGVIREGGYGGESEDDDGEDGDSDDGEGSSGSSGGMGEGEGNGSDGSGYDDDMDEEDDPENVHPQIPGDGVLMRSDDEDEGDWEDY